MEKNEQLKTMMQQYESKILLFSLKLKDRLNKSEEENYYSILIRDILKDYDKHFGIITLRTGLIEQDGE